MLISVGGRVLWRRHLNATSQLTIDAYNYALPKYSRDGAAIYFVATRRDWRHGVWTLPSAGGEARVAVASDDPAVTASGHISIDPNHLYLTVSEYESNVWAARLRW
jgi:hypothetical protein